MQSPGTLLNIEPEASTDIAVAELANLYRKWAEHYYVKAGKPTLQGRFVLI
jgi:hypothetical protein